MGVLDRHYESLTEQRNIKDYYLEVAKNKILNEKVVHLFGRIENLSSTQEELSDQGGQRNMLFLGNSFTFLQATQMTHKQC